MRQQTLEINVNNPSEWGAQAPGMSDRGSSGTSKSARSGEVSAALGEAARGMKEHASDVAEGAKNLASQAGEKLMNSAEQQKAAGADFVSGVAGAIRRAANEFDKDAPQAAQYIRLAADHIDTGTDAFRRRDINQLVTDVQGFARRQPTAFFGAAVLAGFAAVRFLKTSTAGANAGHSADTGMLHTASPSISSEQPGVRPGDDWSN